MGAGVLLVRLTYSRHKGRFMLPGGKVDPGESLEAALVREVQEEAGVLAEPDGLIAVRHRVDPHELNCYLIFAMRYLRGTPRANGQDTDAAAVVPADELRAGSPRVVPLAAAAALPLLDGAAIRLPAHGFVPPAGPYTAQTFQLYAAETPAPPAPRRDPADADCNYERGGAAADPAPRRGPADARPSRTCRPASS